MQKSEFIKLCGQLDYNVGTGEQSNMHTVITILGDFFQAGATIEADLGEFEEYLIKDSIICSELFKELTWHESKEVAELAVRDCKIFLSYSELWLFFWDDLEIAIQDQINILKGY